MAKNMNVGSFERIFKDNNSYKQYSEIPFMEPLARVAETYLYTEKAVSDDDEIAYYSDFRLSSYIDLHDFMSLAAYFIGAASTTHVRATIAGYIRNLSYETDNLLAGMEVHYDGKGERMWITDSIRQFQVALLWITYIYCDIRSTLDGESAPRWKEATETLHDMLEEQIGVTEDVLLEKHHLYRQTKKALQMMCKYVLRELKDMDNNQEAKSQMSKKDAPSENSVSAADAERIRELEAQNAALTAENEHLKGEVADLRTALEVYETTPDIDWHDKVRLELGSRLLTEAGADTARHGNKARAARVLRALTDLPFSTCSNYVTNRNLNTQTHSKEVQALNSELQALGTKISL